MENKRFEVDLSKLLGAAKGDDSPYGPVGKTLQEEWDTFQKCCLRAPRSEEELKSIKRVFFAGITCAMACLGHSIDTDGDPLEVLESIQNAMFAIRDQIGDALKELKQ